MTDETSIRAELPHDRRDLRDYAVEVTKQRDDLIEKIEDVDRGVWDMDDLLRFVGALR